MCLALCSLRIANDGIGTLCNRKRLRGGGREEVDVGVVKKKVEARWGRTRSGTQAHTHTNKQASTHTTPNAHSMQVSYNVDKEIWLSP